MGEPLRFTKISLKNWKNFREVNAALPIRVFLVGPNASGKSNFLDALRFLRDVVAVGGGLQSAVHQRGGVSAIRCLAARSQTEVHIGVHIGNTTHPNAWGYELSFVQLNSQEKRPVITRERVLRDGEVILDRPDSDDAEDRERLTQTFLEQVNANRRFRNIAEFLGTINYLHIVPQLVREPDRSVGRKNDPYGGDFLEQIARTSEKFYTAQLKKIRDTLRIAVPQLKELKLWRDARGTPHLRGKYEHWRPQGAWQTEEQFSDGTLRLMGLLWATSIDKGPLLLEEPELSLNAGVVRYIPQMFARIQGRSGRQIVVSTHSTDLLLDTGIGLDEVFILTPSREGTVVSPAADSWEIKELVDGGLSVGEAVLPHTRPERAEQLYLFGDKE